MEYPKRLIPQVNYTIMAIETSVLDSHYLVRHTKDKILLDPITQKLKRAYIGEQTFPLRDISVNLLGSDFIIADVYLIHDRQDPDFEYFNYDIWQKGENIDKIPSDDYISEDSTRGYYFLKIVDFNNQKIAYTDDFGTEYQAEIKILHTPTRRNYWHFSVRTFNHEGDLEPLSEKEIKKPWRKLILSLLRGLIIETAILDENKVVLTKIPVSIYQK